LLLVASDLEDNSTGRVYVLWLLARHLSWECVVIATREARIWPPLVGSEFAASCLVLSEEDPAAWARARELARSADLMIAAKPLPRSLGAALRLQRETGAALLVDIDDPDIEARLGVGRPLEMVGKALLRPRTFWPALHMRSRLKGLPRIVSNPFLETLYGGRVVPHARKDTGDGEPHVSEHPSVVFVGTNRRHKGVELIRRAVATLQPEGFTLTVTDAPPRDAHSWERWIGPTTLAEGIRLVRSGDIVVLPGLSRSIIPTLQLPAKLIDAMVAGRAIVVGDVGPMTWALGGAGRVLRSSSQNELVETLRELADPNLRATLGASARRRGLDQFGIEAVAPKFAAACNEAISARKALIGQRFPPERGQGSSI
jgi:glycosyltransferase involved in cell wall biosynthesis